MVSVLTWNTQGTPVGEKRLRLDDYVRNYDFVLLQECGELVNRATYDLRVNRHTISAHLYAREQAGDLGSGAASRCSTAIISKDHNFDERAPFYLPSGCGREALIVRAIGYYIASVHCVSSKEAGGDRGAVLRQLSDIALPVIVGGDWNCEPEAIPPWGHACSGSETQQSGRELDYFYFLNCGLIGGKAKCIADRQLSDHFAVLAEFT